MESYFENFLTSRERFMLEDFIVSSEDEQRIILRDAIADPKVRGYLIQCYRDYMIGEENDE